MAHRHHELTEAGARLVGISVDPPPRNAAMIHKLNLPFPVLSDPDGEHAIKPYGVWHEGQDIARPAVVLVDRNRQQAFRQVSRDFADRVTEDGLIGQVNKLGIGPVMQEPPLPGTPQPGPKAIPLHALKPYFRGARFAVIAMKGRHPETASDADEYADEMARYTEAITAVT